MDDNRADGHAVPPFPSDGHAVPPFPITGDVAGRFTLTEGAAGRYTCTACGRLLYDQAFPLRHLDHIRPDGGGECSGREFDVSLMTPRELGEDEGRVDALRDAISNAGQDGAYICQRCGKRGYYSCAIGYFCGEDCANAAAHERAAGPAASGRLLYDPDENPDGALLEDVLEQLLEEVKAKDARARLKLVQTGARSYVGARETALVLTKLEEALLWQWRRGYLTGAVKVALVDPRIAGGPT